MGTAWPRDGRNDTTDSAMKMTAIVPSAVNATRRLRASLQGLPAPQLMAPPRHCCPARLPWPPLRRVRSHRVRRSEEHTSELQSLMRISYAVFCLKKQKTTTITPH